MRQKSRKRKMPVIAHAGQRIRELPHGHYMADFTRLGNRERKCFRTLAEARTWINARNVDAVNLGRAAFSIDEKDRIALTDFRAVDPTTRLADVFGFWMVHHPAGPALTVEALADDYLDAKHGRRGKRLVERREATTEGHRKRLISFLSAYGARAASQITPADVDTWKEAGGWTGINLRNYLASVRALFNHGIRKGVVGMNPAEAVEWPHVKPTAPVIMSVKEVQAYLNTLADGFTDLLPREALSFFCGLRPEELSRLDWRNVSLDNRLVTIEGDVAKIQGHRRHVEIPDNAVAWLASLALASGPVYRLASASALYKARRAARRAAGVPVPDNAGRHAFASYHLALHQNAAQTAEALGHPDATLLKNVYRNITASDGRPITQAAAAAYFATRPKTDAKIIHIRRAAG